MSGLAKEFLIKLAVMLAGIVFFCATAYFLTNVIPYEDNNGVNPIFSIIKLNKLSTFLMFFGVIGYLVIAALPNRTDTKKQSIWLILFWVITLLISAPFALTKALFGNNEVEPILIFFLDNQLNDMMAVGLDGFAPAIKFWSFLIALIFATSLFLLKYKKHFNRVLIVTALILIGFSPLVQYIGTVLVPNAAQRNFVTENRLFEPVILEKPDKKKNLVLIYLESVERSYGILPEFSEFYKPLKTVSNQAVELTNLVQTVGTNYTIAGIVASQCGIPLVSTGLKSIFFQKGTETSLNGFLPSIHCLGDQLSEDGYTLSYMNGASLDKFSKRTFLREHGFTRLFDVNNLTDSEKEGRDNVWGLNDALLFEEVHKEFDTLASQAEPFVLSILSISTHGPNAFLDKDCAPTQGADSQIPRAIQCTGLLVQSFTDHIRNSIVGNDTIIVIMSDHFALYNTVQTQLDSVGQDRRNLFMMLGAGVPEQVEREMAPYDIYPTLLESLGYKLRDGRANFGFSSNSLEQNLVEELGVDTLNKTFKGNQNLARYLWRD